MREIEELREKIIKLLNNGATYIEVLEISRQLDRRIIEFTKKEMAVKLIV